jgi:D-serine dehydratase
MANQLVGRQDIDYTLSEIARDDDFDFYCLVDSVEHLEILLERISVVGCNRPLQLLIEMGFEGGRAGCREIETAMQLARRIKAEEPKVVLRGVEAFEGILPVTADETRAKAESLLDSVVEVARLADGEDLFGAGDVLLTAGGSSQFDTVRRKFSEADLGRPVKIVLRSGCYITHDLSFYNLEYAYVKKTSDTVGSISGDLVAALEVWAHVQSIPEPGLAIAALGKRDISHDIVLPEICRRFRPGTDESPSPARGMGEVTALNDQHAYLRLNPGHDLAVGDLIAFGLSHPCTTFDKWKVVLLADDDYNVVDAIRTFF